jgi:hypothetical protein
VEVKAPVSEADSCPVKCSVAVGVPMPFGLSWQSVSFHARGGEWRDMNCFSQLSWSRSKLPGPCLILGRSLAGGPCPGTGRRRLS